MTAPGGTTAAAKRLADRFADLTAEEFVAECRTFTGIHNTLPSPLPKLRRRALRTIREDGLSEGRMLKWIARNRAGLTPHRFSRLTRSEATA